MTYRDIVSRLETIREDMQKLHDRFQRDGHLDPQDETRWTEMGQEFEELLERKQRLEKQADLMKVQARDIKPKINAVSGTRGLRADDSNDMDADPMGEVDSIGEQRIGNPWDTSEIRLGLTPEAHARELRARAETAIEKMTGTTDKRREAMQRMLESYETSDARMSQQLLATSSPDYMRAFAKLAKTQGRSEVLNDRERAAVARAMSLTDTAGGFLVPFQLDPTVILTSEGSENDIRQIARQVVATGDVWHGVSAGAVSWSFDAEAAEVSDDSPTFAQPTVTIRTARGFVPISLEAYQDEANVANTVATLLAEGKDDIEARVFVDGTAGANEPVGLITALSATDGAGNDVTVDSATGDTFAVGDVYATYNDLGARYRRRLAWLANPLTYSAIRQFDTAGGGSFWTNLGGGTPERLLGQPVYEADSMDGTITAAADNYILVAGDFRNYVIADRVGLTVEFVPQLFATANNLPTGQRGWFAYYRVGADVVNVSGFRLLNVT